MSNKFDETKHRIDRLFIGLWVFGQMSCLVLFALLIWILFSKPSDAIISSSHDPWEIYPKRFGFFDVHVAVVDSKPEGYANYNWAALLTLLLFIFMILYVLFLHIFIRSHTKVWFKSGSYSRTMIVILAGVLILLISGLTVGKPTSTTIYDGGQPIDYDLAWSSWMFNHAPGSDLDSSIRMYSWSKTSIVIFSAEMIILTYALIDGIFGLITSIQRFKSQKSYHKLLSEQD